MAKGLKMNRIYDWVPYFALVCLLVLCYIATVHAAEKKIRKINEKHQEIEDVRREYISIKKKVQHKGTLYEIVKDVKDVDMGGEVHIPKKIEYIDAG